MKQIENLQINIMDLIDYVSIANSDHDRDTVFAYIENYLREEHQIDVDINEILGID